MNITNDTRKLRVGITQGDINGIGIEVIVKVLANTEILDLCVPVVYGSSKIWNYHRHTCEIPSYPINTISDIRDIKEHIPNLVECMDEDIKVEFGRPSKQAGRAAFLALEAATTDLKAGNIDVLVTAPISKENIQSEDFTFPGHTEYLQAVAGEGAKALMVLCCDELRVALVTMHIPLSGVPTAITQEAVIERLLAFDACLRRDFNIERPRIAVLSLNPHAGENGLLGKEEQEVILPAMQQAEAQQGILSFGPFAADGFFGTRQYRRFDGVLAMYHDQGLTAFKTLAMDEGVNYTAGLPIIRTSPDHGTGYDIAGQGVANETSLRHAIFTAIDIYRRRQRYDEATANPLGKLYQERGKDNVKLDLTQD